MEVRERMFLFFVGKTNADVQISLLSSGAELKREEGV